jgi:hypothetical protein
MQPNLNRSLGDPEQLGDSGLRHVSAVAKRQQAPIARLEPVESGDHGQALGRCFDSVVLLPTLDDTIETRMWSPGSECSQRLVASYLP